MKKTDIRPYTRQFYKNNKWRMTLMLAQTVINTVLSLLVSWLIKQLVDMMSGVDIGISFAQLVGVTILGFAGLGITYGCDYVSGPRLYAKAMEQYKNHVFEKISEKGVAAFQGENTNLYISALSNDCAKIETGYLPKIIGIVNQSLLFVATFVMMMYYSPILTGITIALCIAPVIGSLLTGNRVALAEKKVSDENENYMSTLRDSLGGFSVIKSFKAEIQMCRLFAEDVKRVAKAKEKRAKLGVIIAMISDFTGIMVQMGVFLIGTALALAGYGITAGTVMIFVQLINYLLSPISTIPSHIAECKASRALIRKMAEALEENVRESGLADKTELEEGIRLENLSFSYEEGKKVLDDISFTFEKGKSYALVGASGCGKSTMLNLLMASSTEYEGKICYDDMELREISGDSLYGMLSLVQQNVFVFNESIRDNITMFSEFPQEEVDRAIKLSGLSSLIAERGEDYLCGENGNALSGGEKQRISIARSLLKKSQILLVDEATAALDPQTAFQVSDAILDLDSLTRIVVTHSLEEALLKRYDCILTLKNGKIVETGNFEELMEQKAYFYSLYTVSQ
ncbi:MAG: ABC transporter ATP-binding protein [Lachnospiraceae bacterium]|nr:ABC transporter ATP-binding protein [Lachnospiraceae bacterium]